MNLSDIGLSLREARKRQGRSQGQLASVLGMSRATISAIENGTVVEIGVRKVMALCTELGLALTVAPETRRPTLQELRAERRGLKTGG
jgi:transcriptional regulator with XRE-family HTH domain